MASISGRAELLRSLLVKLVPIRIGENSIGSPSSMDRGLFDILL